MAANRAPENPYLAARQEWNERYGSYVRSAAAWRIVGILGLSNRIGLPAIAAYGFIAFGLFDVFAVPQILARKWRTPD